MQFSCKTAQLTQLKSSRDPACGRSKHSVQPDTRQKPEDESKHVILMHPPQIHGRYCLACFSCCISSCRDALLITHVNPKCQVSVMGRRIKEDEHVCSHFPTLIGSRCCFVCFFKNIFLDFKMSNCCAEKSRTAEHASDVRDRCRRRERRKHLCVKWLLIGRKYS